MFDNTLFNTQLAFNKPAQRLGVDEMLAGQHPLSQRVGVVTHANGHHGLHDDGPVVELGGHKVHCGADHFAACVQSTLVRVQAREGRQQRGVNVEQTAGVMSNKGGTQHAHEASQHNQIGRVRINGAAQRRVEVFALRKGLVIDHLGADAPRGGKDKALGIRPIGDHGHHLGGPCFISAALHDGLHVRAPARDQDDDAFGLLAHGALGVAAQCSERRQ